ncbi:hypothetical protein KKF34_16135, partial [Myxococcota bacterium]|nr:hypothetical protein [Myxococcota bacterium]MBU1498406.1 hypothetical protein [Myxococcota bacterium]
KAATTNTATARSRNNQKQEIRDTGNQKQDQENRVVYLKVSVKIRESGNQGIREAGNQGSRRRIRKTGSFS